jgi:ribosomal-protein-alanine N-acetyltransferase
MKNNVLIRDYQPKDKAKILHLLRLNTPQYFAPAEENDLVFYLENEIEHYFVLEYANAIIGCGGINFSEDKTRGKISWDIMHPDFQGKSLGRLLLDYRLEKLKTFPDLQSISVRTSQLAYSFYEKSGFQLVEKIPDYWAQGFDLYRMEYVEKKPATN